MSDKDNDWKLLVNYIVNDEEDKANKLFHDIVIEHSREIFQNLLAEDDDNNKEMSDDDMPEMSDSDDDDSADDNDDKDDSDADNDDDDEDAPEETGELEDRVIDVENKTDSLEKRIEAVTDEIEEIKAEEDMADDDDSDDDSEGEGDDDGEDSETGDGDSDDEMGSLMGMEMGDMEKNMGESISNFNRSEYTPRRFRKNSNRVSETKSRAMREREMSEARVRNRVSETSLKEQNARSRRLRQRMEENAKLMAAPKADLADRSDAKSRKSPVRSLKGGVKLAKHEEKGRAAPKASSLFGGSSNKLRSAPKPDLSDNSDAKSRKSLLAAKKGKMTSAKAVKSSNKEEKGRPAPKAAKMR